MNHKNGSYSILQPPALGIQNFNFSKVKESVSCSTNKLPPLLLAWFFQWLEGVLALCMQET
jgi:hypothetical protein